MQRHFMTAYAQNVLCRVALTCSHCDVVNQTQLITRIGIGVRLPFPLRYDKLPPMSTGLTPADSLLYRGLRGYIVYQPLPLPHSISGMQGAEDTQAGVRYR